jgi:dephospho-CoA kinase
VRTIGLTGGIASGKSTVARILVELGAPLVDADLVAREVVEPSEPAFTDIVREFGPDVVGADGKLDRKTLAARVFSDAAARARLNAITHPRIGERTGQKLAAFERAGAKVAVYEAALLVENGIHHMLDGLIVVKLDEATQLERLKQRDRMSDEEARARLLAQLPLENKLAAADYIIDNSGTLDETRRRVEEVWRDVLAGGPR